MFTRDSMAYCWELVAGAASAPFGRTKTRDSGLAVASEERRVLELVINGLQGSKPLNNQSFLGASPKRAALVGVEPCFAM